MLAVAVVACAHQIMSYCKIVALDVETVNDFSGNLVGNVGGEASKSHFLAGSGFYNNAGTLTLLDDATRTPQNVSSIAANGTYLSRLTLANTGDKTNWITASPSDELAVLGYQPSISAVAASTVDIGGYAPLSGGFAGTTETLNSILGGSVTSAITSDVMTITHPATDISNFAVGSMEYGVPGHTTAMGVNSVSATEVDVYSLSDMSGRLSYDGASWNFITDCIDCSWATTAPSAGGTIRVTHATTGLTNGGLEVLLTSRDPTYMVAITASNTTYFEIAFINYSGTVVTTPDTNMKVVFRKKAWAQSTFSSSYNVIIKRDAVPIPTANLQNVSGGEVFVAESMDY